MNHMNERIVFEAFVKQLQKSSKQKKQQYYSSSSRIQSSVGLIFRMNGGEQIEKIKQIFDQQFKMGNIEVLLTQRAGYEGDPNAYNIVFPGGQADQGESDLIACKRELEEEINLKVDQQCHYLGCFPQNFFYSKKRGKSVYIRCHSWIMRRYDQFTPKLSEDELIDYRWVPLKEIINPQYFTTYALRKLSIFNRMGWQRIIANKVKQKFIQASFPAMNVGMQRKLWGISLHIMGYFLQMAQNSLQKQEISQDLCSIITSVKNIDIQFKPNFIFAKPIKILTKKWYQRYRVKPFTYPPISSNERYYCLLIFFCLLFSFICIFFII